MEGEVDEWMNGLQDCKSIAKSSKELYISKQPNFM